MSAERGRSLLRKLALAVASVFALLAVLELGVRVRLRSVGAPWDADAVERELATTLRAMETRPPNEKHADATGERRAGATGKPRADATDDQSAGATGDERADASGAEGLTEPAAWSTDQEAEDLHPYLGFDSLRMREQLVQEVSTSRRTNGMDIFVAGGSMAASFVGVGTSRMTNALRAAPNFPQSVVRIWGEGRAAYKQPQQANALAYALSQGVQPEFVVVIDGFEDLTIAARNAAEGMHPLYPSASKWRALASNPASDARTLDRMIALRLCRRRVVAFGRCALDWKLARSALAGSLVVARMAALRSEVDTAEHELDADIEAFRTSPAERGPKFTGDVNQTLRRAVDAWTEGARSMWGLCRERGIPYLHVLQPTLHDQGSKPLTDEERAHATADASMIDVVRRGYPALRARGAELARAGVPFLDASRLFVEAPETLYLDDFRLNDAGLERLGTAIGERMRAELERPAR